MDERKVLKIISFDVFMKYIRNKRVWVVIGCKNKSGFNGCVHMVCNNIKNDYGAIGFYGNESHIEIYDSCNEIRQIEVRPDDPEKVYEMVFERFYVSISEDPKKYGH